MGGVLAKLWSVFLKREQVKVIVVGLDNAGKTTVLYKLLFNEVVATAPTIGSNVEEINYRNVKMLMWDLGGQDALRAAWPTYYANTKSVILVVDSSDHARIALCKAELHKLLLHELLRDAILLVFANKQDVEGALKGSEISNALQLPSLVDRSWHIQACCALTGEGLSQGMDWMVDHLPS